MSSGEDEFEVDDSTRWWEEAANGLDEGDEKEDDNLRGLKRGRNKKSNHASNTRNNSAASSASPAQIHVPATISSPVTSHFDAVLECIDLLRHMKNDMNVEKQDVIDSMESMLHGMLSTIMMNNFATSMSVNGWVVQ